MSSGAKPKTKLSFKKSTRNSKQVPDSSSFARTFEDPDGKDDKLVNQAVHEGLRILENKARKEYGIVSNSIFCQHRGPDCTKVPVFIEPLLYRQKHVSSAAQKQIKIENIFISSKPNQSVLKPILLIGEPGFGKTTMMARIANDWATKTAAYASQFRLVIVYSLSKLMMGDNLQNVLLGELARNLNSECTLQSVEKILSTVRDMLLIILDDYEQVPIECRPEVSKMFDKDSFFHSSTIIVSSRPDALVERFTNNFKSFITICPFDNDRREQMIDKHFKTQPEIGKKVKTFLKTHHLRALAFESLEIMSVILALFEEGKVDVEQADSTIVFQIARMLILRSSKNENSEKNLDEEKLNNTIYRIGKLFLQKLKASENSFDEKEFDILGSTKNVVCKSGLLQVRRSRSQTCLEIRSKTYLVCLSAYYLNAKIQKLKTVSDIHAFLRKNLGDSNNMKTLIFKKDKGYLVIWGSPSELAYVCRGSQSFFSGCFETMQNLKSIFGDYVCKFKDPSMPKLTVYAERKSTLSLTETFSDMIKLSSKQVTFHFGSGRQEETQLLLHSPDRFPSTGYIHFEFAIDGASSTTRIVKHDACDTRCLKVHLLPIVLLKDDFLKTLKYKNWILVIYGKCTCCRVENVIK